MTPSPAHAPSRAEALPGDSAPRSRPRTAFVLVRHGETEGNRARHFGGHAPTPLSDLGRAQAQQLVPAIVSGFQPTVLVSSDLVRARETAAPIAAAAKLPLAIDARFRERGLGYFEGMSAAEARQRHPDDFSRLISRERHFAPRGGETPSEVYARVSCGIEQWTQDHQGQRIVVVSHGLAIYYAFCHIAGLGDPVKGHPVFFVVANASISEFARSRSGWEICRLNDCAHLV